MVYRLVKFGGDWGGWEVGGGREGLNPKHSHKSSRIDGSRNVVHGTLFKSDFNTIGMKMYPRSRYGIDDLPNTGTYVPCHVPCDCARRYWIHWWCHGGSYNSTCCLSPPQKKNSTVWANTARTKYKISKRSSSVSFPFDYLGDLVWEKRHNF